MRETFYETTKWKRKRAKILKRDNYLDKYLEKKGILKNAEVVHHILPREQFPQYEYEDWNLISLTRQTHRHIMHNAFNGKLTKEGERLMYETAFKNGIKLKMKTMVIGLEGSGKSTYVKKHLYDGICYDLDYIASAFRLRKPHEEYHASSRRLANDLFKAFSIKASEYNSNVFIIRTAPNIKDLNEIQPNKLVVCKVKYDISKRQDLKVRDKSQDLKNIEQAIEWAKVNGIEVEIV